MPVINVQATGVGSGVLLVDGMLKCKEPLC